MIDSNVSPVLLWEPGRGDASGLRVIRRKGTRVWGLQQHSERPYLDISLPIVSTIYALPDALTALQAGAPGRH